MVVAVKCGHYTSEKSTDQLPTVHHCNQNITERLASLCQLRSMQIEEEEKQISKRQLCEGAHPLCGALS